MLLKPCLHCTLRSDCEIKRDIQSRAKGLPLTVASFKCRKRDELFARGERVSAQLNVWVHEPIYCADGGYYDSKTFSATVISCIKRGAGAGKIAVWLDEPTASGREIVKLWPDRLKKLDEQNAAICHECGKPEGKKNRDDFYCESCGSIPSWMEG